MIQKDMAITRNIFLLFFICFGVQAQNKIQTFSVSLDKKAMGYSPYFINPLYNNHEFMPKGKYQLPTGFDKVILYKHRLQTWKSHINICEGFKAGKKHIFVDTNNDCSFLDEKDVVFDTIKHRYNLPYDSLPLFRVKYLLFDGKDTLEHSTQMKINPFPFKSYHGVEGMYAAFHENLAGTFNWNGEYYHIKFSNDGKSIDALVENNRFEFYCEKGSVNERIGDFFIFLGKLWRVTIGKKRTVDVHCLGAIEDFKAEGVQLLHTLPAYQFQTFDNKPIALPATDKSYTILYAWSSRSARFQTQITKLKEIEEKYKDQLTCVGLAYDENWENAQTFMAKNKLNHPQMFENINGENDISWTNLLEIKVYPTYILLDRNKKIIARHQSIDILEETLLKLQDK